MIVARGLLQNPADFDKRVENLMRTSPGLIRMKGGSDAEQSAQTKVSREIIQKLAPDEEKVALAKIERLTKEIVAYAKLTGRKRFPLSRAKHYAMLEVASSLVDNGDFENRVKADARMWTRKSDWFATHVEEATEAFKRSVASNILEAISEQESPAVEAKLDQSSKKYLKQWKADASRSLSDRQISQKFSLYRKDALIVLAAEHVSEVTRYRAERSSKGELITSNKGGAPARRRTQEYRIAFKVTANLEAKILDDCLLRAEALAVALTEVYIQVKKGRKPGRVNFMDIIVPFDDQNSARSSERDASEDDETSNNGEKLLEGDNPEMPAAKRLKTATFDERRI